MTFSWAKNRRDFASVTMKVAQGLAGSCAIPQVQVTQEQQLLSGGMKQGPLQEGPWEGTGPYGPTSCTPGRETEAQRGPEGWLEGYKDRTAVPQTVWHQAHS